MPLSTPFYDSTFFYHFVNAASCLFSFFLVLHFFVLTSSTLFIVLFLFFMLSFSSHIITSLHFYFLHCSKVLSEEATVMIDMHAIPLTHSSHPIHLILSKFCLCPHLYLCLREQKSPPLHTFYLAEEGKRRLSTFNSTENECWVSDPFFSAAARFGSGSGRDDIYACIL